jgi:hypothetical protein
MNTETFLETVLDAIEEQEAHLLVWGVVDGCLNREELLDLIDPILDAALSEEFFEYFAATDVIEALTTKGLIFETSDGRYQGFRSRMAETVRLLFYLRQLFPKHGGRDGWQNARTLVSDFRFLRRRRKYPRRNIPASDAFFRISRDIENKRMETPLRILLSGRGEDFSLSEFQLHAATRILEGLTRKQWTGTLVSAGTGSGKTLAFYLPALTRIADHIISNGAARNWVKCLALYPRTELLRDQFSEIYREARRLDPLMISKGRKIRIGAFFGATPYSAKTLLEGRTPGWERKLGGFTCGFLACPTVDCKGDLVWNETDIQENRERLCCSTCNAEVTEQEVTLTRQSLENNPPDILFTTTEMLNQRMTDSRYRHLFGLRPHAIRPVEMVLLDEVHSYSGFHGSQVAYLLRRWSHLLRAPISFVGLSATLRDGKRFFARMTGLYESQVEEICPKQEDMIEEGAEYIIALKGDPVSRSSLLSTTIQTAMLVSRMLDTSDQMPSGGLFGSRIFAFTDDMDVINRLYFGLLDAEGRDSKGLPNMVRHPNGGLAVLRSVVPSTSRDKNGQNWTVPQALGHDLADRKNIGRTSSQDPGVVAGLDVVVATASLEVGFNDPSVGAVIQHKAPRGVASFLQRKGRAGRSRKMRPWTVLVLSDYGRDRLAYQAYDHLFNPELTIQAIPLSSRYIQHIQAVYGLIDYLGKSLSSKIGRGSVWSDLSSPSSDGNNRRSQILAEHLACLLRDPNESEKLRAHLLRALRITNDEVDAVLWEHPRPLMTAVIPTALRRLETNWRSGSEQRSDYTLPNSPLPEFAPGALFDALNLPEVRISLPPDWDDSEPPSPEVMPISQAMRNFAPGRVSRRFGVRHAIIRHWIAPEPIIDLPDQAINIDAYYGCDQLGEWQYFDSGKVISVPAFRPFEIRPIKPDRPVKDTSNAQLIWHSQIVRHKIANRLALPGGSAWKPILTKIDAYTHGEQQPIEMRRFTTGSIADIQIENKESVRVHFEYIQNDLPVVLGYSVTVDALRLEICVPEDLWKVKASDPPQKWRSLRTARFLDLMWHGDALPMVPNPFMRQWLATIYIAALTYDASHRQITLVEADAAIQKDASSVAMTDILETFFQSSAVVDEEEEENPVLGRDQLREELEVLLRDPEVLKSVHDVAPVLWAPVDNSWETWLTKRFKATIAAAALDAITNLCPDMETDGLVVDFGSGPRTPGSTEEEAKTIDEIWISETSPGGTGIVENLVARYAEDPRRFYALLTAALQPNEHELVDYQLVKILKGLSELPRNEAIVTCVDNFRASTSAKETDSAFESLRQALYHQDFVFFHSFATALNSRILRSGSNIDSDKFLFEVLSFWLQEEERLGVELDSKMIAYSFSQTNQVDQIVTLAGFPLPDKNLENWRFNVICGMLWPRGGLIRNQGLDLYSPFNEMPEPERLLLSTLLTNQAVKVSVAKKDWQQPALEALSNAGIVTLVCPTSDRAQLADALNFFATNPVQSDYISVFARLDAMRRVDDIFEADFELAEASQ